MSGQKSQRRPATNRSPGPGIGLRNLESRLATRYGPDYVVTVDTAPGRGYCLRLSLPFLAAAPGVSFRATA